jgi:hypothetical protein
VTDELLESAWRLQMLDVIGRYAHCMDSGDFDGLEALFAEDSRFDIVPDPGIVPIPIEGRRAIREALEARYAVVSREAQRRHLMATTMFDAVDEKHATAKTFLAVLSSPFGGGEVELRGTGVYHDTFARVDGRWVFAERVLHVDELKTS